MNILSKFKGMIVDIYWYIFVKGFNGAETIKQNA